MSGNNTLTLVTDPLQGNFVVLKELEAYSPDLAAKQRITALNKIDALDAKTLASRRRSLEKAVGGPVFLISGVSRQGVTDALRALWRRIESDRAVTPEVTAWRP